MFKIKGTCAYLGALFLNAFTDLGHMVIIQSTVLKSYDDQMLIILTAIVNALMLLPFILLFSPAGFLSDKFPKNLVMKHAAAAAIGITLLITLSYYMGWFVAAFILTFFLSLQSAIFAPAKYGYIKELLGDEHISVGNAAVQSVTTVAILSSIIIYSFLFESSLGVHHLQSDLLKQIAPLGWLLVMGSVIEWHLASKLPNRMERESRKRFDIKKYKHGYYLRKNFRLMRRKPLVWDSIVALSLFWIISLILLNIFGAYAKSELGIGSVVVVQGVIALAAIGVISGALFSSRVSRYYIHLGAVPFGTIMMTSVLIALPFLKAVDVIAAAFLIFGFGAGLFIVPLNALIQHRSPAAHLGSILAGNHFMQTLMMLAGVVVTTMFAYLDFSSDMLYALLIVTALLLALHLVQKHLVMLIWVMFELLLKLRYKIVYEGTEHLGKEGAVLLLGNHISWIDWLLIQFPVERRIHYLMEREIYEWRWIKPVMRLGRVIPISSRASKEGFARAREHIVSKEVVGMFPEGAISHSGELGKFYRGFELIGGTLHGKIIPLYIDGLYGSVFSRSQTHMSDKSSWFRRVITIRFGEPMPLNSTTDDVKASILKLKEMNAPQET